MKENLRKRYATLVKAISDALTELKKGDELKAADILRNSLLLVEDMYRIEK